MTGVWYRDGLRFACQPDCNICCRGTNDDPGVVYVTGEDIDRLAAFMRISRRQVIREHLEAGGTELGTERRDGVAVCRFLRDDCEFGCTIHEARPLQCRSFPWWPEVLESPAAWDATAAICPGIGRGRLWSLAEIREVLRQHRHDRALEGPGWVPATRSTRSPTRGARVS